MNGPPNAFASRAFIGCNLKTCQTEISRLLLVDINRSIYGTCGKIGGFRPQLRHKQVGRIIRPVILDVRELKQKS